MPSGQPNLLLSSKTIKPAPVIWFRPFSMMLRLQTERMRGTFVPSTREYFHFFGLDSEKLAVAKPDALVMHPGPMNRGVEIDSELADDMTHSAILDQVELGVAVRMACLDALTSNLHADTAGMVS